VRLVSIASNLELANKSQLTFAKFRDGCSLLQPTDAFSPRRWTDERLAELKAALSKDPDIIVFPEFAYPVPRRPLNGGWTIEEVNQSVSHRLEFDRKAVALLEAHRKGKGQVPFVFLGSYHCLMSLYNVGVIYPWADLESTVAVGPPPKVANNRAKNPPPSTPILYRKRFPARKLGEQTRVPNGLEFNVFERPFGKIGLLICSDVLDLNQFLRLIRESVSFHQGFEFILIPSYSPRGERTFETVCEELSYLTGTAVVVTCATDKSLEDERGMAPSDIYICGERVSEVSKWKTPYLRGVATKPKRFRVGLSEGFIFDVSMPLFRRAREAHLRHLLGDQTATRIEERPL